MNSILLFLLVLLLTVILKKNHSLKADNRKICNQLNESVLLAAHLEQIEQYKQNKHILNVKISKLEVSNATHSSKISELQTIVKSTKTEHKLELKEKVDAARKDAIKKSRAVIRGQATEHLAPYILADTNPKDYRFMGNPIDYICFEGLSDLLDGVSNEITSIHFIDIKTGKSSLSKSQRRIRDAIKESRVQFSEINLDKELEKENDQIKKGSKSNDTTKS